jgi:hypothetical protein
MENTPSQIPSLLPYPVASSTGSTFRVPGNILSHLASEDLSVLAHRHIRPVAAGFGVYQGLSLQSRVIGHDSCQSMLQEICCTSRQRFLLFTTPITPSTQVVYSLQPIRIDRKRGVALRKHSLSWVPEH